MRTFGVAALCAFGLLGDAVASQLGTDMKLEDAGFVMRRADTADKLNQLKRLPPLRFIARNKGGQRYYVYADPANCQCVFVGNAIAMQAFRDMRSKVPQPDNVPPSGIRPDVIMENDMDDDVATTITEGSILDSPF